MKKFNYYRGFTLIELLLSITLISLLAVIVLVSVNPTKQLSLAQDLKRQQDISKIQQALDRYSIRNNGQYPSGIVSNQYKEICGGSVNTNCVDLSVLEPTYLSSVPVDPTGSNYKIALNPNNSGISLWSDKSVNREISVNQFISATAIAKDSTFDTGTPVGFNNSVSITAVQSDGKVLVGGRFTSYQGLETNRLVRLNSDGSRDTSFNIGSGFSYDVSTITVQSDGKILVGGEFWSYKGGTSSKIIRLNSDGSRDTTFNIGNGFSGGISGVSTIAIQSDGKILVGGGFGDYQGISSNRIIRLNSDGSRDTSFNVGTGFDSNVNTIVIQSDGKIVAGGSFSTYQGVSTSRLIRLNSDGSRDSTFSTGSGFGVIWGLSVNSLLLQTDGKIVVGGYFTTYQGVSSQGIVRLTSTGTRDSTFSVGTGFNSVVYALALQSDGKIIAGGQFTTYQGVTVNRIVRLSSTGGRDTTFSVGTGFTEESGGTVNVYSLNIQSDGKILAGGSYFTTYQGVAVNTLVRLNSTASLDTAFSLGSGFDKGVYITATQSDGKILVGGSFNVHGSTSANSIVRLNSDGTRDSTFNVGTGFNSAYASVSSIAIQNDGKILVGGFFTSYQGSSANYIIRLNSDGSIDTTFNIGTGFDYTVNAIAIQSDGKIVVGGGFTSYKGASTNYIARLNTDGSLDTGFNTGTVFDYSSIYSLDIQSDGKIIVGGEFYSYNGEEANSIVRLNSNGTRDTTFNLTGGISCTTIYDVVIASDGKLLLGGQLYNDQTGNYQACLSRLNSNGSKDTSFNVSTGFNISDSSVYSLILQSDGKIVVGGIFSTYQGSPVNNILKLNSDGSLYSSVNYGSGFNDYINSIKLQNDGKIIVSGLFGQYNDQIAGYLTRLNN